MADNKLSRVARAEDGFFDDDDPLAELARIVGQEAPYERTAAPVAVRREPEFDLEDELMREFEKFDAPFRDAARSVSTAKTVEPAPRTDFSAPAAANIFVPPTPVAVAPYQAPVAPAPAKAEVAPEPDVVFSPPVFDMSDFGLDNADDLEPVDDPIFSELANVAAAPRPPVSSSKIEPPVVAAEPASAYAEWKTDRLQPSQVHIEPAVHTWSSEPLQAKAPSPAPSVSYAAPSVVAPVAALPVQPVQASPSVSDYPAQQERRIAERRSPPALNDMLADVERYPIIGRANPVDTQPRPSVATPTVAQVLPAAKASVSAPVSSPADPFDGSDFQIDLDSIELELTEMANAAPSVSTVDSRSRSGWENAASKSQGALHFDPSQIAETEEHLETISDLEVPSLPVIEKDDHVPSTPDYYMEIDTEMGNLFDETMQEKSRTIPRVNANVPKPLRATDPVFDTSVDPNLDEFERELEDEFRQSLLASEPADMVNTVARTRAKSQPEASFEDEFEYERPRRFGRTAALLAASLVGVAVFAGAGYYAWNHTNLKSIATTGEPRIILADKEPSKVVPEDKGGQTVPNQDKAVYDKVAGANTVDPKQKVLISGSEDPVDVVQKTLAPETPSDTNGQLIQLSQTETADTQDNRLLPATTPATGTAATLATDQPSIAPRKVKTMIVRADGTLVQRQDGQADKPVAADKVAKTVETASTTPTKPIDTGSAQTAKTAVPGTEALAKPADTATAPAAPKTDMVQKPASAPKSVASAEPTTATTPAKPASAATTAAANPATPAKSEIRLTTNTEAQANAGNAASITDAANADVPVTVPAHKVKTTTTGNAPVPGSRPADQPVNVVGTVTANGNVIGKNQTAAPAKQAAAPAQQPVQVAAANPTPAPAASSSDGNFGMQIASLPSEAEAKKSFSSLQGKFGGVLSGRSFEIRKAEVAGKGTYYRVRVPVGSKDEAAALCAKYRAAGGSCLISK